MYDKLINMYGMNFFLIDPLRPAGDVWGVDGVDAARPSVLYVSTGT